MTTAAPSTALVTIQPAFTDPKRLAVAEFVVSARAPQMWGCDPYWAYGARRPRRHRAVAGKVVPGRAGRGTGRQLIGPVIIPVRANMSSRFSSPEVRPCPLSARARALASARRSRMSTSGGQYPNRSRVQGGGSGAVTEQAVPFGFQRDGFRG